MRDASTSFLCTVSPFNYNATVKQFQSIAWAIMASSEGILMRDASTSFLCTVSPFNYNATVKQFQSIAWEDLRFILAIHLSTEGVKHFKL